MFLSGETKKIINNFIKDRIFITSFYFVNTIIIILFFFLYTDGKVKIVYPIILSAFIYLIFISFDFYKYMKFNRDIIIAINNPNYDIVGDSYERKEIGKIICLIHTDYINKINEIKEDNNKKNKFLSQWIHNMKTPVSVIDLILQKSFENMNTDNNAFEELQEENDRLLNNLEQVLNMIRIDDFSKDYVPESMDLCYLLKKIINERKNQFIYNNVFPKLNCGEAKFYILSDIKWNEFMVGQIINNAIKYSSCVNSSKSIYFDIRQDKKYTILTIRDEGLGIPEYDLKRVFEPFFTGENGRKYRNSTGIGLYVCSVICEKLGHDISIKSEEGKGTEVRIKYLSKL